jgi:hypothetical protein
MAEVLQEINSNEEIDTIEISVSFIIRSESLVFESLSEELGLKPTRLWNKDEEYIGKQFNTVINQFEQVTRKRHFSIWEVDSSCFLSSKRVEDHIKYMVNLLMPKQNIINRLLGEKEYFIKVNIFKKSYAEVIDYQIDPKLLTELISLCKNVRFSNYYVPPSNDKGD